MVSVGRQNQEVIVRSRDSQQHTMKKTVEWVSVHGDSTSIPHHSHLSHHSSQVMGSCSHQQPSSNVSRGRGGGKLDVTYFVVVTSFFA